MYIVYYYIYIVNSKRSSLKLSKVLISLPILSRDRLREVRIREEHEKCLSICRKLRVYQSAERYTVIADSFESSKFRAHKLYNS